MIRLQPGSTRTVSLFPDTTLVRSQATAGAALGLWVLISLLMTASAVALAGLPLATLAFLGFLGTTVTAMLAIVSGPLLAMGAALFTILLMLSCLTRGRELVGKIGRALCRV